MSYKDSKQSRQISQIQKYLNTFEKNNPGQTITFQGIEYTVNQIREEIKPKQVNPRNWKRSSLGDDMFESLLTLIK